MAVVASWGLAWFGLGNAAGADICGATIAGSWDVTADVVFPAILVMPQRQFSKWEFISDGPLGGEAFLGGERRRYRCRGNSYALDNFFARHANCSAG
jgi:hypothetical protein